MEMHNFEPSSSNKIGRSVSLRLANKPNFRKPKFLEFDFQHGNLSLVELLDRTQNEDAWMFERPSLYERRKKRQMIETGQQQQQYQQQVQQQQQQVQQQHQQHQQQGGLDSKTNGLASDDHAVGGNRPSASATSASTTSTSSSSSTTSTSSSSSTTSTSLSSSSTSLTTEARPLHGARSVKPALPPKPKPAFPASLPNHPKSSSSSSSKPLPSSSSSSFTLEISNPVERINQGVESSARIAKKISRTTPSIHTTPIITNHPLNTPRSELPPRFRRLLPKVHPNNLSPKHLIQPKRLSILTEANDDDDNDDGGHDDDGGGDDDQNNKEKIMKTNFKGNNINVSCVGINGVGFDDDPERYKSDLIKALEWIQEEMQQLKVKDRALFRSFVEVGRNIQQFHGQETSSNDSQQHSLADLSPSSVNNSCQAEADDSPVFQ